MTFRVKYKVNDREGEYTVVAHSHGEAWNYTVEDISEDFSVKTNEVKIISVKRID